MQEALMTDAEEAPLVIIKGMAGTAKTFYALAVGMEKVYNNPTQEYRRVIVCRPNAQFDDDIGFLPGDEKEKIAPLMRPVIDNLEQILDSDEKKRYEDDHLRLFRYGKYVESSGTVSKKPGGRRYRTLPRVRQKRARARPERLRRGGVCVSDPRVQRAKTHAGFLQKFAGSEPRQVRVHFENVRRGVAFQRLFFPKNNRDFKKERVRRGAGTAYRHAV